jgi:hypothetical protein
VTNGVIQRLTTGVSSVSASFTIDRHRIARKGKIRNGTNYRKVVKGTATVKLPQNY